MYALTGACTPLSKVDSAGNLQTVPPRITNSYYGLIQMYILWFAFYISFGMLKIIYFSLFPNKLCFSHLISSVFSHPLKSLQDQKKKYFFLMTLSLLHYHIQLFFPEAELTHE